jgi:type VI secretion system secreted protein Hcp
MPATMFLEIDGIKGESTDSKHKDKIDILTYSWGESQKGDWGQSGKGCVASMVEMQEINFTFEMCKASPKLMESCATGKIASKATFTVRKAGGDTGIDYLTIKLENVLVSSYQTSGHSDAKPVDSVTLRFDSIVVEYTSVDKDKAGGKEIGGYSLKESKKKS